MQLPLDMNERFAIPIVLSLPSPIRAVRVSMWDI